MTYYISYDHAGIDVRDEIIEFLQNANHTVVDLGPKEKVRVDYPDEASKVCKEVIKDKNSKGILICGSGLGMSMAANKYKGIRAALCANEYSAKMAIQHNNANVLCLGQRVSGLGMIEDIIDAWLNASFQEGRHALRVEKINAIDDI